MGPVNEDLWLQQVGTLYIIACGGSHSCADGRNTLIAEDETCNRAVYVKV